MVSPTLSRFELVLPNEAATQVFASDIANALEPGDFVTLSGDLGAGKTTLTQGIGRGLGVRGAITSPTFVIARVHPSTTGGPPLVHVDAYRLESLDEVDDLDLDASLDDSVTVVEWGEGKVEGLAEDRLVVRIDHPTGDSDDGVDGDDGDEPRTVTLTGIGARWDGVVLDAVAAS